MINISHIKNSPSKVKYFNAIIDDGKEERKVVCYKDSLHRTLSAANLKDEPVKISNYIDKIDEFDNCQVITLVDRSTAEFSTANIPFEKVRHKLEKLNTFMTLKEIESSVPAEESVNCIAYASLNNSPEEINTKYGRKMKRDILLSDHSSQQLKLTLWNNQIDLIRSEGTLKFKELRVKV